MCGIVGYVGGRNAAEELYEGLTRLEYRGYDSAGICTLQGLNFYLAKHGGRVNSLCGDIGRLGGNIGIGHTRWATHGEANDINAHPHVCNNFAVVHNGIIENYGILRDQLKNLGVNFVSETDSEVVVHLLNYYYNGDLLATVKNAVRQLKGSYALAILCRDFDGLCVVKYKSPAIVGYGKGEYYLSSDMTALGGKAKTCAVLEDGDIAILSRSGVKIYDGDLREVVRRREEVASDGLEFSLGGCPHYMIKEIKEGASAVINSAKKLVSLECLGDIAGAIASADKIIMVGCGTAYNSCLVAKYWLEDCGCNCVVEVASELRYFPPKVSERTVVLAVSQSGETADTVEAALILKEKGAKIFAVTNSHNSAITRIADCVLPICAGGEICVAATKSYLGQLACLYLLRGAFKKDMCGDMCDLTAVAEAVTGLYGRESELKKIAHICAYSRAVLFLGREIDYAVAVEGSLKLKEVSYIFSDAYPAGELKHGTLALIDENTLCIVVICVKDLAEKSLNAVEEILSRKGKVAVITSFSFVEKEVEGRADYVFLLPKTSEKVSPFLSATALQYIAYFCAVELGLNPDKPRNLAKSVTVE